MLGYLKDKTFDWVRAFYTEQINKVIRQQVLTTLEVERANQFADRDFAHAHLIHNQIGKPCIYISNEWGNPVVGFGEKLVTFSKRDVPFLIVHDYISGQDVVPFGKRLDYSPERLELVFRLNPWELCALVHDHTDGFENKAKLGVRDDADMLMARLTENGFFERLDAIKDSE